MEFKAPKVVAKRKYTHSPAVERELTFKRRLNSLMKLRRERAFIAIKADKIQRKVERLDRRIKAATKTLIREA